MRVSIAAVCCALAVLPAPAAFAQEPGVSYDPDDPAGKQYALPLDNTRRKADGGESKAGEAPLFGAGVSQSGGPGVPPGGAATETRKPKARKDRGAPHGPEPAGASRGVGPLTEISTALADGEGDRLLSGGLIAVVVALAALLVGLAVRRFGNPSL